MLMTVNGLPILLELTDTKLVEHSLITRAGLQLPNVARAVAVSIGLNLRQGHGCLHCRDAVGRRFTGFFPTSLVKMIIEANRRGVLPPAMDIWPQCRGVFPGWPDDWPTLIGPDPVFAPMPGRIGRCA